jgi:hypothetical protein
MAGNGIGRTGGKHSKQVVLENSASSKAHPRLDYQALIIPRPFCEQVPR